VEVVHARCAGLDISKRDAKVCVRVAGAGCRKTVETVTTWGSMTSQILALRDHLIAERITCAVMEATSDYWKPFYYLLEDAGFDVLLVNARHVKNLPGRKTDVADATWLAQLGAHGLVRASFVPPEPIRQLRDLTRARTAITRERSREVQRLEKLLEDAGIKLSAVASDILGVSGRAMVESLIAGNHDPAALADLAKRRLRSKIPALTEALTGRFTDHHAFLARVHLDLVDQHTAAIDDITTRIEATIAPFHGFRDLICTIPGISTLTADVIIRDLNKRLATFPDARIVWAHRDPFTAAASFLRLNYLSRAVMGADVDVDAVVGNVLRQLRAHITRPLQTRRRIGDDRFFDLHYADLMRDPIAVMRSLYDWAADDLTAATEHAMLRWLEEHPQGRHGIAAYSLDGSGVTRADLEPLFDEYLSVFDVELEDVA